MTEFDLGFLLGFLSLVGVVLLGCGLSWLDDWHYTRWIKKHTNEEDSDE